VKIPHIRVEKLEFKNIIMILRVSTRAEVLGIKKSEVSVAYVSFLDLIFIAQIIYDQIYSNQGRLSLCF
jgi:hypothetical protein